MNSLPTIFFYQGEINFFDNIFNLTKREKVSDDIWLLNHLIDLEMKVRDLPKGQSCIIVATRSAYEISMGGSMELLHKDFFEKNHSTCKIIMCSEDLGGCPPEYFKAWLKPSMENFEKILFNKIKGYSHK